jgi:hypothetical protein
MIAVVQAKAGKTTTPAKAKNTHKTNRFIFLISYISSYNPHMHRKG